MFHWLYIYIFIIITSYVLEKKLKKKIYYVLRTTTYYVLLRAAYYVLLRTTYYVLSNDIDTSYEQCTEAADSVLIHAGVENKLLIEHAQLITQFENEIDEYPGHVCCSCECLYLRKSVTKVKLTDKLGNSVWSRLKEYILGQCPNTDVVGTLYMCHYCKSSFKNNKLPPSCVLNLLGSVIK